MPGKYIIGGKEVSRSTFYRHKDRQIGVQNERSVAASNRRLTIEATRNEVVAERVDSFRRLTSDLVDGPDNDDVTITVPRRWLKAVSATLAKVA